MKEKFRDYGLKIFFSVPFLNCRFLMGVETIFFLTYHSISYPSATISDNLGLCVPPPLFETHMRYIREYYHPISMAHAEKILAGDETPIKNAVVVTFDDGYRDNFSNAFPILKKYDIPATIFLITGLIGTERRPWLIDLYFDIYQTKIKQIELKLNSLKDKLVISLYSYREKLKAMLMLRGFLKNLDGKKREQALEILTYQLKRKFISCNSDHLKILNWDEVVLLKRHGITFGSHTVNHLILDNEEDAVVVWEVQESKRTLEDRIQSTVTAFAYPGAAGMGFSQRTKNIIRNAGYNSCYLFSTGSCFNKVGCDLFALNRGEVLGSKWELAGEASGLMPLLRNFKQRYLISE